MTRSRRKAKKSANTSSTDTSAVVVIESTYDDLAGKVELLQIKESSVDDNEEAPQVNKRKRRRLPRKRRFNFNDRIQELLTLVPAKKKTNNHKGVILQRSVEHIKSLHDKVDEQQQRIQELENQLKERI